MEIRLNHTYLIIGTNLGDKLANLNEAIAMIKSSIGDITKSSSIYETEPWGITDQPTFFNQVVEVQTQSDAFAVLQAISKIEKDMGRIRGEKYGARIIDIDILFFNNEIYDTPELTVPHPRIAERNFVLAPLAEIAGHLQHPVSNKPVAELWNVSKDKLGIKKIKPEAWPFYICPIKQDYRSIPTQS